MRLKVFQAPNMGAAMAMVRDELGLDALILSSTTGQAGVEVTAAADHPAAAPQPSMRSADPDTLASHGVPESLGATLAQADLVASIRARFKFCTLPLDADAAPLMLVGPPGAGKTTATARLAARLKLRGTDSLVITADGRRAGAAEQLAAFTRLLDLTLIVANAATHLSKAMAKRSRHMPALIDMPGLSPFDQHDRQFLLDCKAATNASIALVLPAGLDPADAEELATAFKSLGATALIATRLDQSRRLGGILAAAAAGLALAEAGISAQVADGLTPITAEFLAARLSVPGTPNAAPSKPTKPFRPVNSVRTSGDPSRAAP